MKISHQWLRRYVPHDLAPEALADRLTMLGLEVDGVEPRGQALGGVVVGHVEAVRAHPNADRLQLCDVRLAADDDGAPVQIVCGAPNVAAGQRVPVATVGTTLHLPSRDDPSDRTPVTIREAKLRGEASHGMICAEDELGLSDDHGGIMVLDADAPVGQPFADYLAARGIEPADAVFDIDLTPNRPDATSHLGVGRDVAAATGTALRRPPVDVPDGPGAVPDHVTVTLDDATGCPRYAAMIVRGVTVGASPLWLKRRLTALGLRPRNNVVDITNFVLHECGQPLHAFDLDRLAGPAIAVRRTEGETAFTTLDDTERTLPDGTLVICDAKGPVAVAGVMGGASSEVTEATTDVLIESAYFDPSTIRRTAKALGLSTDSSYRFERGVDRTGQPWAAARAAQLMADLAGGTVVPGLLDVEPVPASARVVTLRPSRLAAVLGVPVPADEAVRLLRALGFRVDVGEDALRCTVPPFRPDVSIEEDLIEEVARLWGYDRIPTPAQVPIPSGPPQPHPAVAFRDDLRGLLRGLGFREVYTNSLLRTARAAQFATAGGAASVVETLNPVSREMAALRPRLLPGLLQVMQHNRNHGQRALRLFEFGHVFARTDAKEDGGAAGGRVDGFAEHEALAVALTGPVAPAHWHAEARDADVFDLKGVAELLLDDLGVTGVTMTPAEGDAVTAHGLTITARDADGRAGSDDGGGNPDGNADSSADSDAGRLGTLVRVAPDVAAAFDLDAAPVFVAEFDVDRLRRHARPRAGRVYEAVARFPAVERDLAVVVRADQPVGPMLAAVREAGGPLLEEATVFDLYAGEGVPAGQQSVAFALRFGAADRTLTDDEVDTRVRAVVETLHERFDATLRG